MDHREERGVKKTQGVQNIKSVNIKIKWINKCILSLWFISKKSIRWKMLTPIDNLQKVFSTSFDFVLKTYWPYNFHRVNAIVILLKLWYNI